MRDNVVEGMSEVIVKLIAMVWEFWFPLKINVFSWQLLQDKILTHQISFQGE